MSAACSPSSPFAASGELAMGSATSRRHVAAAPVTSSRRPSIGACSSASNECRLRVRAASAVLPSSYGSRNRPSWVWANPRTPVSWSSRDVRSFSVCTRAGPRRLKTSERAARRLEKLTMTTIVPTSSTVTATAIDRLASEPSEPSAPRRSVGCSLKVSPTPATRRSPVPRRRAIPRCCGRRSERAGDRGR